jgi:hypothetical protein
MDKNVRMNKTMRVWVDGELLVDEAATAADLRALAGAWQETIALASKRDQPWRLEFGDQDADVDDEHWRVDHEHWRG